MKYKYFLLSMGVCLAAASYQTYAATSDSANESQLASDIQKINMQTAELQQEVKQLKAELRQVKRQRRVTYARAGSKGARVIGRKPGQAGPTSQEIAQAQQEQQTHQYSLGSMVTTSPYIGLRSAYDASDLIVNQSTMNEDLRLLQQRQALENSLAAVGTEVAKRPLVMLSGGLEGQGIFQAPYVGKTTTDIDLTRAELDAFSAIGPWAQAFMSITYDNAPLSSELDGSGDRVNNSRLYLKRGFMTIGNLNKSPIYFSLGQMYVPFGTYANDILSDPPTKLLGRTTARAALLGFSKDGLYLSGYAFNGATNVGSDSVEDYGANAGYGFTVHNSNVSGDVGMGVINNIADSIVMQDTGASSPTFEGFSDSSLSERIAHRVPAVDTHAQINLGQFTILSEYVNTTKSFDATDLTFNNAGAAPKAFYAEGDYNFNIFDKPSAFVLAYGQTWESLALGLPKNSYITAFNISIWKNTIESIEFRHDVNYAVTDVASGKCAASATSTTLCTVPQLGGQQNTVLAQLGVYF